jgi:hypothetical protein
MEFNPQKNAKATQALKKNQQSRAEVRIAAFLSARVLEFLAIPQQVVFAFIFPP